MSFIAKCPSCGHEQIADDSVAGNAIMCGACRVVFQTIRPQVAAKPSGVSQAASVLGFISVLVPFFGLLTAIPAIICGIIGLCTAKPGSGSINRSLVGIIGPIAGGIISAVLMYYMKYL